MDYFIRDWKETCKKFFQIELQMPRQRFLVPFTLFVLIATMACKDSIANVNTSYSKQDVCRYIF